MGCGGCRIGGGFFLVGLFLGLWFGVVVLVVGVGGRFGRLWGFVVLLLLLVFVVSFCLFMGFLWVV